MKNIFFLILTLVFTYPLQAQDQSIYSIKTGKIDFQSDAPNELISASSNQLIGLLDISKKTFAFKVAIKSFEGFNSALQREHFNENYLESNKYPDAVFNGKIIEEIDFSKNGNYTIRAKGFLTVHGIKQERIIKSEVQVQDNKLLIKSNFSVELTDHDIPIPKVVKDKLSTIINVEINCRLEPR